MQSVDEDISYDEPPEPRLEALNESACISLSSEDDSDNLSASPLPEGRRQARGRAAGADTLTSAFHRIQQVRRREVVSDVDSENDSLSDNEEPPEHLSPASRAAGSFGVRLRRSTDWMQ